jgi:hypothetical protein
MWRLSAEQRRRFDEAAGEDFVHRAAELLEPELSVVASALGNAGLRNVAREAIPRAARHGIRDEHGVYVYLNLMLQLGSDFDVDPQLRSVASTLTAPRARGARLADLLSAAARPFVREVLGERFEHLGAAMARLVRTTARDLPDDASLRLWLAQLYPQRVEYLGAGGLSEVESAATQLLAAEGGGNGPVRGFIGGLMLVFGTFFHRDPALPWGSATLGFARSGDADVLMDAAAPHLRKYGLNP